MCRVIFLFAVGIAMAANPESQTGKSNVLQSANRIMGSEVKSNMDEKLGSVKELIVNQSQDDVQYVIISSGDKLHPVPWTAIKCGGEANEPNASAEKKIKGLTIDITKDRFTQSPTVESMDMTTLSSSSLKQRVDSFYSTQIQESESTWKRMKTEVKEKLSGTTSESEGQATNLIKGSDLIGMNVKNLNDEELASIKDIVIDSRKGNLAYGLLGFGGVLGVREKVAAVPWSAIAIQPDHTMAKLDATKDKLESAILPEGRISELNQRQFAQRVHEVFGVEPYWQVYGFEAPSEESGAGTLQKDIEKDVEKDLQKDIQKDTEKEIKKEIKKEREGIY